MPQTLINEHQAAERLGVKVKTLRGWRCKGGGPSFVKLGGAVRYDPADLDAFVQANKQASTSTTEAPRDR